MKFWQIIKKSCGIFNNKGTNVHVKKALTIELIGIVMIGFYIIHWMLTDMQELKNYIPFIIIGLIIVASSFIYFYKFKNDQCLTGLNYLAYLVSIVALLIVIAIFLLTISLLLIYIAVIGKA